MGSPAFVDTELVVARAAVEGRLRRLRGALGLADWRGLADVGRALGEQWRGGLIVYAGAALQRLGPDLWAVPVDRLLA